MKPPTTYGLPYARWRVGQQSAITAIEYAAAPVLVLQAPTGTGKSAIALGAMARHPGRAAVLTATRALQDQYQHIAGEGLGLVDIRGMANYPCLAARDEFADEFRGRDTSRIRCDEGPCRLDVQCSLKEYGCAYFDQARRAVAASRVSTSYAYWLASRRHGRGLGHVDLLVCDEAHDAAEQLARAMQITLHSHEFGLHRYRDGRTAPPQTIAQWVRWAATQLESLERSGHDLVGRLRVRTRAEKLEQMVRMGDGWAWAYEHDRWVFEPVDVRPLSSLLFAAVPQVVLMSATITPDMVQMLGLDPAAVAYHSMPMRFPVERRPVYLVDAGRIDFRAKPETIAYWLQRIDQILESRDDRKGIVHTVSYDRQQFILRNSAHAQRMIAPASANALPAAIEQFRAAPAGAILISPSVVTGYDFPYDAAEYQVLTKVPFPNTRSAIAKARCQSIPHYREIVTATAIQQATGRIVRADDDQGETFICDEHARWFVRKAQAFFTDWFLDAVQIVRRIPPPPPRLRTRTPVDGAATTAA